MAWRDEGHPSHVDPGRQEGINRVRISDVLLIVPWNDRRVYLVMDQRELFETQAMPMEAGETFEQRLASTKQKYESSGWTFVEVIIPLNAPSTALFRRPRLKQNAS